MTDAVTATASEVEATRFAVAPEGWTTPERRALSQMARSFVEREIAPKLAEWEQVGEIPRDLHLNAAEVGLLGIGFPEEVGGSGGNAIDSALVTEAILAAGGSTGVCAALFTHGIALPHIAANGSEALIERYVRPTLAGRMIGSLGVTEPGAGSDVANLRTRAVRDLRGQRSKDVHHQRSSGGLRYYGGTHRRTGLRWSFIARDRQEFAWIRSVPPVGQDGMAM